MLWASGVSYATHSMALSDGRIEAYVKKACAEGDPSGIINVEIVSDYGPFDIVIKDDQGNISHSASVEATVGKDFIGSEDKTGLLPGTYTVQVTDSQCAVAEMVVEVGVKDPINISANPSVICADGEGSISPEITGGEGNYTFLWNNGATTQNITGLSVGNFTVTVTDAGGCSKSANFEILKNDFEIKELITCDKISLSIFGSIFIPTVYKWSNGATSHELVGIPHGLYTVTVTRGGCQKVKEILYKPSANITANIVHDICDLGVGSISLFAGSNSSVNFKWLSPVNKEIYSYSSTESNLHYGLYSVEVCGEIKNFVVENTRDPFYLEKTPALCSNNGSLKVKSSLSIDPNIIQYKWSNGATTSFIQNLPAGGEKYYVTITINNECSYEEFGKISNLSGHHIKNNPTCDLNNGSINWNGPEDPNKVFTFLWNTGATTSSIYNLGPGLYSVTVTEDGCQEITSFGLHRSEKLKLEYSCSGSMININVIENQDLHGLYYEWRVNNKLQSNTSSSTSIGNNLATEDLFVVVTAENTNCSYSEVLVIPKFSLSKEDVIKCSDIGILPGQLLLSPILSGLQYNWSTGEQGAQGIAIAEGGLYSVTATLGNCDYVLEQSVYLHEFEDIHTAEYNNPTSPCSFDGYIELQKFTSNIPVRYKWSTGHKTSSISGLGEGIYNVTVSLGPCEKIFNFELCACEPCNPGGLDMTFPICTPEDYSNVNFSTIKPSTSSSKDGEINGDNDTDKLSYAWYYLDGSGNYEFLSYAKDIKNLKSGLYKVIINNGCGKLEKEILLTPVESCINPHFHIELKNSPCVNGNILVTPKNTTSSVTYICSNGITVRGSSTDFVTIPTKNPGIYNIKAIENSTGCEFNLQVTIDKISSKMPVVDIPLFDLEQCVNGKGRAFGKVTGENIISTQWTFNGKVVSNTTLLEYSAAGYYTFSAIDQCGFKASKSILLSCSNCSDFPIILQENPCFDECGFAEINGCSRLKIAVNCKSNGRFTVVWPNGSLSGVDNCDVYQGVRKYRPEQAENRINMPVKIINQSTGCVKELFFTFSEPWCHFEPRLHPIVPVNYGVEKHKGGCNEAPNSYSAEEFQKFNYQPLNFADPCRAGFFHVSSSCPDVVFGISEVINLDTEENKYEFQGEVYFSDYCLMCLYQHPTHFDGEVFGVELCLDEICPSVTLSRKSKVPGERQFWYINIHSPVEVSNVSVKITLNDNFDYEGANIPLHIGRNELWFDSPLFAGKHNVNFEIVMPTGKTCKVKSNDVDIPGFNDPDCESVLLAINNVQNSEDFALLYSNTDSLNNLVLSSVLFNSSSENLKMLSQFPINNSEIIDISLDTELNQFILGKEIDNSFQVSMLNNIGQIIWSKNFDSYTSINILETPNNYVSLVGFDQNSEKWVIKTLSNDGNILEENTISLDNLNYSQFNKIGENIIALNSSENQLVIVTDNEIIQKAMPQLLSVKDIKSLENGNILIAGDYKGEMTLDGKAFNSDGFKNAIFLTYNVAGTLLSSQSIQRYRDETVQGIATKGNSEVAYFGKYEEVVNYFEDPTLNEIDSCNFIEIIHLDGVCTPFPSILTYDHRTCQLSWDAAPSGYTTALQMEVNGVWLPAEKALGIDVTPVSPYTITKDGKYRLLSKKEGCPDIISNIVQTSCTASCACEVPVLSYSANNCQLTWTNSCATYTVSLQRLNNVNIWETVVQQAVSPYNVQTNGQYRLYLSTSATNIGLVCPPVSSNTVTTACTPSTNTCSCNAPTLSHNSTACTLTWSVSGCTGYTTTLQRSISGVWTSISASSPYTIPTGSNGQYRILTSKAGCTDVVSNIVNVTCSCSSPASITIFDYGTSGLGQNATIPVGQSYTHEVSQGAPDACDDSYIQLAFSSSVVNSSWNFYVNGTIAVMPGTVIGSQYVVDLYLPTPPSDGTADVFIQSPCGDFYQLHLVYDCAPGCNMFTCQSFFIEENCYNTELIEAGNISHSVLGSWNISEGCSSVDAINLANNIRNKIIEIYPTCNANMIEVYFTINSNSDNYLIINNSPMDVTSINFSTGTPTDGGLCLPENCPCTSLNLSVQGDEDSSCENLTIITGNGESPYSYNITGLGSQGTQINQTSSSNLVQLNSLLPGETINLDIVVTDANGCQDSISTFYTRCNNTCQMGPLGKQECICANVYYVALSSDNCRIGAVNTTACTGTWVFYLFDSNGNELINSINLGVLNNTISSHGNGTYYLQILCSCGFSNSIQFTINCSNNSTETELGQRVSRQNSKEENLFRFFPNPFSKGINLEMNSDIAESVALQAYNTVGTLMFERKIELLKGVNLRYIDAFENVPSGVYIVKIKSPTKDYTTKVIRVD